MPFIKTDLERKKCRDCGQNKLVTEYYKNGKYPQSYCKRCTSKRSALSTKRNRAVRGSTAWYRRRYDHFVAHYKHQRLNRGFDLTIDDFIELVTNPCFYCDEKFDTITIDRVDNSIGYLKSNCVGACNSCNRSKNSISVQACRRIIAFVDQN